MKCVLFNEGNRVKVTCKGVCMSAQTWSKKIRSTSAHQKPNSGSLYL